MKKRNPLIHANELTESTKTSMKTRIIVAVVAAIPLLACLFLGDWFFLFFATAVLAVAVYELLGVINRRTVVGYILFFIALALIMYWPIFRGLLTVKASERSWHVYTYFSDLSLSLIVLVSGLFLVFLLTVIDKNVTVRDACFLCALGILVALGLQCMLFLRFYPLASYKPLPSPESGYDYLNTIGTSLLVIYVFIATFATDIGAYFIGVFFGKNKMNERISPKKTWEGFVGGIVFSFLLSFSFGMALAFTNNPLVEAMSAKYWYNILVLSLILPFFATLGDFVFSSIKRYYDIKDFGNILPGHGGVLDRFDSLIFVFIVTALYILIFTKAIHGENPLV